MEESVVVVWYPKAKTQTVSLFSSNLHLHQLPKRQDKMDVSDSFPYSFAYHSQSLANSFKLDTAKPNFTIYRMIFFKAQLSIISTNELPISCTKQGKMHWESNTFQHDNSVHVTWDMSLPWVQLQEFDMLLMKDL